MTVTNWRPTKVRGYPPFAGLDKPGRIGRVQFCAFCIAERICCGEASPANIVMFFGVAFCACITIRPGVPVSPGACTSAFIFFQYCRVIDRFQLRQPGCTGRRINIRHGQFPCGVFTRVSASGNTSSWQFNCTASCYRDFSSGFQRYKDPFLPERLWLLSRDTAMAHCKTDKAPAGALSEERTTVPTVYVQRNHRDRRQGTAGSHRE